MCVTGVTRLTAPDRTTAAATDTTPVGRSLAIFHIGDSRPASGDSAKDSKEEFEGGLRYTANYVERQIWFQKPRSHERGSTSTSTVLFCRHDGLQ